MTLFVYINQNIDRVKREVKAGIMPCSILRHWEVYARYDYYRKVGNTCMIAVINTCDDYKLKGRMVFHIIRKMEAEIESIDNKLQPADNAETNG